MDRYFLKPAEGRTVRSPQHDNRPIAGAWVESTPYWQRRLDDGDVIDDSKGQLEREAAAAKAAKPAKDA